MKTVISMIVAISASVVMAVAERPRVLIRSGEREVMLKIIEEFGWAGRGFSHLRRRVDRVAREVEKDPDWLRSRLMMNWETHYILPVTFEEKWIGGEGRAPVPTPRFGGSRDWKTDFTMPGDISNWRPFNSWGDQIWLVSKTDGEGEWVHPSETGLVIEAANAKLMRLAAEAAFLHWMTGEERYAKVALPVLWTFMEGYSHVLPPRVEDPESGSGRIIGTTSFEVIHEDILIWISICYDFIQPYLVAQGKNPEVVEEGVRRMTQRVIDGGLNEGNWNLFQAKIAAYGALALRRDEAYADGRGRNHFLDLILHADLPGQRGLMKVVEDGYDRKTALWPEATSYAFETTASILAVANLVAGEKEGRALLENGVLERAILAQAELTHPNGLSVGFGDTWNVSINEEAIEMLIAAAREQGKTAQERRLTAILMREIDAGRYSRTRQSGLYALTNYVGELQDVPASEAVSSRAYFAGPVNVLMMRLPHDDWRRSLSAAVYGTAGGHAHSNGMALELYGSGYIMGPDPGRGTSYWQRDQRHYYSRLPSHNTVIPNGFADYHPEPPKQLAMTVETLEPETGAAALSPNVGFSRNRFHYLKPGATQCRTVATVRLKGGAGIYFDVFRSRVDDARRERCHDYLFHGMAKDLKVSAADGSGLQLVKSGFLGARHGDMEGYDYFRDERSAGWEDGWEDGFRARFELPLTEGEPPVMELWMTGGEGRRLFALDAPPNHAIRDNLPPIVGRRPMPTVLVRQQGEAWERPFVAVYHPCFGAGGLDSVREAKGDSGAAGVVVRSGGDVAVLMESGRPGECLEVEGLEFEGCFAAVLGSGGRIDELYLGNGRRLGMPGLRVMSKGPGPVSASLRRGKDGKWTCDATGPVEFEADGPRTLPGVFQAGGGR